MYANCSVFISLYLQSIHNVYPGHICLTLYKSSHESVNNCDVINSVLLRNFEDEYTTTDMTKLIG